VLDTDEQPPSGMDASAGQIAEVVYLGAVTRYVIELDNGTVVTALRQNLDDSAEDALAQRGRKVRVAWREQHLAPVGAGAQTEQEDVDAT
jgi:putative spermidine/putrescine transport system ATP-binding protein